MTQQECNLAGVYFRRIGKYALRVFNLAASLVLLLTLCKAAHAEESAEETSNFKLGGYSSVSLVAPRSGNTELNLNEISLLLSWDNNERLSFFGELELERPLSWNENKKFDSKNNYLDLERLYFDYHLNEKSNLRAGRFLTPAGRWNLLHAPPLVWTASRPLATSYLFPNAINGLMLHGTVPSKMFGQDQFLDYSLYAETLKDQKQDHNEIPYKDVFGAHFRLNNRINLGLSLASFTEDRPDGKDYRMVGLDFFTHIQNLELSGEGYQRFTNDGSDGGSGAYVQSALALGQQWYWLTRLETFQRPREISGERWVIGLTKRVTPQQLLKMEFVGGSDEFTDTPRGFIASFAVLF